MSQRKKHGLGRLWQLVTLLDQARAGISIAQLQERLGMSRATVYRYLDDLKTAEVSVESWTVTGETRFRLLGKSLPAIVPAPRQLAALHFAREALGSWKGTDIVEQLDSLLARWGALNREPLAASRRNTSSTAPAVLRTLEGALREGMRVAMEYYGINDAFPRRREVDPVALHEHDGRIYLLGYDHGRADYRVYKAARVAAVQTMPLRVRDHSEVDVARAFAESVKVWRARELENVVVRLSADVARFAREYPLVAGQDVETLDDGSVLVRASVPGVTEATRWVLSWGKEAEAIGPSALRDAVRIEVEGAAAVYSAGLSKGGVRKASELPAEADITVRERDVSQKVRRGRGRFGG